MVLKTVIAGGQKEPNCGYRRKHICLPYSKATAKRLNLTAVNTNGATFDVLDQLYLFTTYPARKIKMQITGALK